MKSSTLLAAISAVFYVHAVEVAYELDFNQPVELGVYLYPLASPVPPHFFGDNISASEVEILLKTGTSSADWVTIDVEYPEFSLKRYEFLDTFPPKLIKEYTYSDAYGWFFTSQSGNSNEVWYFHSTDFYSLWSTNGTGFQLSQSDSNNPATFGNIVSKVGTSTTYDLRVTSQLLAFLVDIKN